MKIESDQREHLDNKVKSAGLYEIRMICSFVDPIFMILPDNNKYANWQEYMRF